MYFLSSVFRQLEGHIHGYLFTTHRLRGIKIRTVKFSIYEHIYIY